jgi:hypothetical protein
MLAEVIGDARKREGTIAEAGKWRTILSPEVHGETHCTPLLCRAWWLFAFIFLLRAVRRVHQIPVISHIKNMSVSCFFECVDGLHGRCLDRDFAKADVFAMPSFTPNRGVLVHRKASDQPKENGSVVAECYCKTLSARTVIGRARSLTSRGSTRQMLLRCRT